MKTEEWIEAVGDIKDDYILEAADAAEKNRSMVKNMTERHTNYRHKRTATGWIGALAAAVLVSIMIPNVSAKAAQKLGNLPVIGGYFQLVTFRHWSYEDEHHSATVDVDNIAVAENTEDGKNAASDASGSESAAQVNAQKSAQQINLDINKITDNLEKEFKAQLTEEGYSSLDIRTETVTDSDQYYCVLLTAFQAAGDGYEERHYYTIDKTTGEQVTLKSLFGADTDYVTKISDEIKRQMREQMKSDENKKYWLNDPDIGDENFNTITDDTQFYINDQNQLVISFNEGDVAPMYMGNVEFVMPASIWPE